MRAPYPSPETIANMLADEIYTRLRAGEKGNPNEIAYREGIVAGLRHAAWLLNVEKLVDRELEEAVAHNEACAAREEE